MVGFSDKGGFLSSGYKTKYGLINWLTMQPRMQSVDAYIMDSLKYVDKEENYPNFFKPEPITPPTCLP